MGGGDGVGAWSCWRGSGAGWVTQAAFAGSRARGADFKFQPSELFGWRELRRIHRGGHKVIYNKP
jgi:hypothetical protein